MLKEMLLRIGSQALNGILSYVPGECIYICVTADPSTNNTLPLFKLV